MTSTYREARRKRSWLPYLLLACAVLSLPLEIKATKWFPQATRLVYAALWGSLLGIVLARSPFPRWLAWILGIGLGMEYGIVFASRLLPGLAIVFRDLGHALRWLWDLLAYGSLGAQPPFYHSALHVIDQFGEMIVNLTTWFEVVQAGGVSKDTTVLQMVVSFATWMLSWNAGYELFSRRRTFAALLPLGIGIVANAAYTDIGLAYVHFFLFIMLLLLVRGSLERMEALWENLGLDFSYELRRDANLAGILLSGVVLAIALVMPYMTYNRAVFFFWDRFGPALEGFYDQMDRAFAGRNPVPEPTPSGRGLGAHPILSGGKLSEDTIFIVQTSDPPPPPQEELAIMEIEGASIEQFVPKHYWRERTYDLYTGHGWDSSESKEREVKGSDSWREIDYPHTVLTQTFQLVDTSVALSFAVNEPNRAEQDCRIFTRGEEDLAAFSVNDKAYTIISQLPAATEEELQKAEGDYPEWVKEQYIPLPKIPKRVSQLAKEVASQAGAATRYEKARAVEAYIRDFDYTLDLAPPPMDTDIVEYFLFTAKRGYCDYSATAMVVMLRTIGVASRYASGYGMGYYDYNRESWVVTEQNAHAWVEVYFPGHGWIEFEPTPSQAIFDRSGAGSSSGEWADSTQSQEQQQAIPLLWIWAAVLGAVVLFVIIWPPRWFKRGWQDPRQRIWVIYDKLVRRARWLGFGPSGGQTPREYLQTLASHIEQGSDFGTQRDMDLIQESYQRALYSDEAIDLEESYRVTSAFRRTRGKLLRLAFIRPSRTSASS